MNSKNHFNLKQKFAWFSECVKGCSHQRCLRHMLKCGISQHLNQVVMFIHTYP